MLSERIKPHCWLQTTSNLFPTAAEDGLCSTLHISQAAQPSQGRREAELASPGQVSMANVPVSPGRCHPTGTSGALAGHSPQQRPRRSLRSSQKSSGDKPDVSRERQLPKRSWCSSEQGFKWEFLSNLCFNPREDPLQSLAFS